MESMATASSRAARRPGSPPPGERGPGLQVALVVGGAVAVVLVILVLVIVLGGGSGDADVPDGVEQTRPVEVSGGVVLPPLPEVPGEVDEAIGRVPPSLIGQTFEGTPISVEPGQPTLLVFLAHWCGFCQQEVPMLVQWHADGAVPEGLRVVGVPTGTDSGASNYPPSTWFEREGWPFEVLVDDEDYQAAEAFGLTGYPYLVMVDDEGEVLWRSSGATPREVLEQRVAEGMAASAS
jgi:thiol-disulfide isomerase/thioredoxin